MKFCAIVPINYPELDSFDDHHLVLAPFLNNNQKYLDFYKQLARSGHYVILDNGAAEFGKSIPEEQLFEAIELLGPQEVVAPDVLYDTKNTIKNCRQFVPKVKKKFDIDVMGVPQGTSSEQFWFCLKEMIRCKVDTIGLSRYAIPKCFGGELHIVRPRVFEEVRKIWRGSIHLLGLSKIEELKNGVYSSARSIDSLLPVKYGNANISLRNNPNCDKIIKLEVTDSIDEKRIEIIKDNIKYVTELCHTL